MYIHIEHEHEHAASADMGIVGRKCRSYKIMLVVVGCILG